MNIVIEQFNDNLSTNFGNDRYGLCLEYFNNGIKLSIQVKPHDMYVYSKDNMVFIQIQEVAPIDRYNVYNEMLFYAGSIVRRIHNNGDCDNVCLDWISFCNFATKINLWLANH